jgi:hypothetical protein
MKTEQLKALMALCRLTQQDLAGYMNCSEPMIQKVIASPGKFPRMSKQVYELLTDLAEDNGYMIVIAA